MYWVDPHSYKGTLRDTEVVMSHMAHGGNLIFHDGFSLKYAGQSTTLSARTRTGW